MSPMGFQGPSKHNNIRKAVQPVSGVIDLTSSPDDSDEEEHWEDARQSLSPQKPAAKSKREQFVKPAGLHPAGVFENMPMHHQHQAEAADIIGFGEANAFLALNGDRPIDLLGLDAPQPAHRPAQPAPIPIDFDADIWEDYVLNDEGDLEALPHAINYLPRNVSPPAPLQPQFAPNPPIQQAEPNPNMAIPNPLFVPESKDTCIATLMAIFPGICPDHVSELYEKIAQTSDQLITHILDQTDRGIQYPKAKDKQRSLKRKRVIDEDEEAAKKYGAIDRIVPNTLGGIRPFIRSILMQEFSVTPATFIDATLSQSNYRLFSAYRVLEEAHRTYKDIPPPYNKIKTPRKMDPILREAEVESTVSKPDADREKIEVLKELQAARKMKRKGDLQREAEAQKKLEEAENVKRAELEGTMAECGCCCCDYPRNRMVHCDSEEEMHWFCRDCARTSAEVEIGKSKYDLRCMSTDVCEAGFSMNQRDQFLDEKTKVALERNEQEANLRLAGIENLESCPFCPFAAEYPPVEIDREFRCQAEDCEKVSCRLCKSESHIPKSCEEFAKENGLSIRRQIEEAMSAALIRNCNKCNTPFVKEEGCNKMTCTRNGCMNIQCYVCSKSCSYDHFNDVGRGGKAGNCPLFESVEQRHEDEVKKAEQQALEKILADHPEYTAEDLKVKMSDNVKQDDDKRKARDPRGIHEAMLAAARNGRGQYIPMPIQFPAEDWHFMLAGGHEHVLGLGHALGPHPPPPLPEPGILAAAPPPYVPIRERLRFGGLPRPPPGMGGLPRRPPLPRIHFNDVPPQFPGDIPAPANVNIEIPARIRDRNAPGIEGAQQQAAADERGAAIARAEAAMERAIAAREEALAARVRLIDAHARLRAGGNGIAGLPVDGIPVAPPARHVSPNPQFGRPGFRAPGLGQAIVIDEDLMMDEGFGDWLDDYNGAMFEEDGEGPGNIDFW